MSDRIEFNQITKLEREIVFVLKRLGLDKFFKAVYGSRHMINHCSKDVSRICREQGIAPERTLMVGDIPAIDGMSAQRAGAKYLHVPMPALNDNFTYSQYFRGTNQNAT